MAHHLAHAGVQVQVGPSARDLGVLIAAGSFWRMSLQNKKLRDGGQIFQRIRWVARMVAETRNIGRSNAYAASLRGVEY